MELKCKYYLLLFLLIFWQKSFAQEFDKSFRITDSESQNQTNTWINFIKVVQLEKIPNKVVAKIACDSKYWLWINGDLVVFEGQLKRGPTPLDTYFDEVDLKPFLKTGENKIAVLVWYFGKDGFSHKSSGEAGLAFSSDDLNLYSDKSWLAKLDDGFEQTNSPYPNFRLPESNVRFDANKGNFEWIKPGEKVRGFKSAKVLGLAESAPWNKLIKRPIPLWKNFGLKSYTQTNNLPNTNDGETIVCKLPYNAQITPFFKIEAKAGLKIEIKTDHYLGGGAPNVRAEYMTKDGVQEYESLGWMNGQNVYYHFPKGVKIIELKYRETGFDTEFTGDFSCNDAFFNKLWGKALRTLYVTMRDTYMDCPDRERCQWWGDVVNESGEAFYALSPSSALLEKKGILELINWQRKDGTIFSPIPGTFNTELPGQMLASIGYYGFWNYYLNTGDKETIEKVYAGVKTYLDVWKIDSNGILVPRKGDWSWGDWGQNVDKEGLNNAWYYLALKSYGNMSEMLGNTDEVLKTKSKMQAFKKAFNEKMWNGNEYRSPNYKKNIDDRFQSLAVVAGLVDSEKFKKIYEILKNNENASPYMEKYVIEALFLMDEGKYGLERMKARFGKMVNDTVSTTLYEGWGIGTEGFGGGSSNHAWSGGGLTILSQYVCGLSPLKAGWETFKVKPMLSGLKHAETKNTTFAGIISVKVSQTDQLYKIDLKVPAGTQAFVYIPQKYNAIKMDGKNIYSKKSKTNTMLSLANKELGYNCFKVEAGNHSFLAK